MKNPEIQRCVRELDGDAGGKGEQCEFCQSVPVFWWRRGDYERYCCAEHAPRLRRLIGLDFNCRPVLLDEFRARPSTPEPANIDAAAQVLREAMGHGGLGGMAFNELSEERREEYRRGASAVIEWARRSSEPVRDAYKLNQAEPASEEPARPEPTDDELQRIAQDGPLGRSLPEERRALFNAGREHERKQTAPLDQCAHTRAGQPFGHGPDWCPDCGAIRFSGEPDPTLGEAAWLRPRYAMDLRRTTGREPPPIAAREAESRASAAEAERDELQCSRRPDGGQTRGYFDIIDQPAESGRALAPYCATCRNGEGPVPPADPWICPACGHTYGSASLPEPSE